MPALLDLKEPLSDGHVLLRAASERDIPEILIAYQDDPELHERLGEQRPPSGAELGRGAEQAEAERVTGTRVTLTILAPGSDRCRGQLYVHHIDTDHARAELGIWVTPQARGSGLARQALRLAGGWLLQSCGLERLGLLTEPANEAMLRAARAAGFGREGVLRAYERRGRVRIDLVVLSLLRADLEEDGMSA
ncbi:MAG: GNAT family N-acetyltransferase [Actinomycetota bacterium]|nr:GNAT family N-acetyltransferase [Actinomycetota bacterium]